MDEASQLHDWGSVWSPYISVLPKDPAVTQNYVYVTSSDRQSYWLYTALERGAKDPQACNSGAACLGLAINGISGTACGKTCNYGVSSPNTSP
ncbi:MAG: hypothetical protein A2776_01005 [Candidatus Levybacteria bacterium RIFCSPHIGHO2_01_FULL_40_10]|nr:MAG: hypothetical protein A2776_01005 [Candidatus Levybacteria bacterium RIFCSPHIGHO2_01_FULL_40_10]